MTTYDRKELLMKLLIYSDIVQDDLENISHMNFRNGHTRELDGVRNIYEESAKKENCVETNIHRNYRCEWCSNVKHKNVTQEGNLGEICSK